MPLWRASFFFFKESQWVSVLSRESEAERELIVKKCHIFNTNTERCQYSEYEYEESMFTWIELYFSHDYCCFMLFEPPVSFSCEQKQQTWSKVSFFFVYFF